MGNLLDPPGPEIHAGEAASAAIRTIDAKRKEYAMQNAIEPMKQSEHTISAVATMTPMDMLNRAVSQGAGIEVLEKLMGLQERWEANQARKAFDEAMAAAKAEIPTIKKNRTVDFTSSKGRTHYQHEDLAEVAKTVNPILSKYGLSYRFRTSSPPNEAVTVTCVVSHRLGYSEENTLSAGRDESGNKNSIQAVGSTLTYLQRMTLKAALGLAAAADDDGKHADDTGTITEAEREIILTMVSDTESDIEKFCEVMGIESVATMPAAMFRRAVAKLQAKKQRVASNG